MAATKLNNAPVVTLKQKPSRRKQALSAATPDGQGTLAVERNDEPAAKDLVKLLAESQPGTRWTLLMLQLLIVLGLVVVPAWWCWTDRDRASELREYRQKVHKNAQCFNCEAPGPSPGTLGPNGEGANTWHHFANDFQQYVPDVASAGLNGLLALTATVLGGIAADVPARAVLAMGMSSLVGRALSSGFVFFFVESSKDAFSRSQMEEEYHEVQETPDQEASEMVCHYQRHGLSREHAERVAAILSQYEDFWVHHMMQEELNIQMPRGMKTIARSGLAMACSFFCFGMVPLLGIVVPMVLRERAGPQWYRPQFATLAALGMGAALLLFLAALVERSVGSATGGIASVTPAALVLLLNGAGAAMIAFVVGQACSESARRWQSEDTAARLPKEDRAPPGARQAWRETSSLPPGGEHMASAWPHFRRPFLRFSGWLWICLCTFIVLTQIPSLVSREAIRVLGYGWLTCVTTGLGALPFAFVAVDTVSNAALAVANAVAGGMMLSASYGMLQEAHEHCGRLDWQLLAGLALGALFLRASEKLQGEGEEAGVEALHTTLMEKRHLKKAMLIFIVMFCHSAAEGVAVGVAFSKRVSEQFGLYVSLLLAVHNIPEGLAVALVLVPRGVSTGLAAAVAVMTSIPQPFMAVAAFMFVDAFGCLLPLGLAFAAGAMIYVCFHELLAEAQEHVGQAKAGTVAIVSFAAFSIVQGWLHQVTET